MNSTKKVITAVLPESIAEEMEIEAGDFLLAINDQPVGDVFDYRFLMQDPYVELLIQKADGEEWLLEIEKDEDEDIGLVFSSGLMDDYRHCANRCIFCFIDQMPKGMRDTLYFKDDDSRLSFLQGNYVTMTNMSQKDLDRIIAYRMSPINISVHATDPQLRCRMLGNKRAGDICEKMKKLRDADIAMNAQIVVCKGVNDKENLEKTLQDLLLFSPQLQSVSVVPVGLTRFREGLEPLEPIQKDAAKELIDIVENYQRIALAKTGSRFVYASDELYLTAQLPFPSEEEYEDYPQLENGVGMARLFISQAQEKLEELTPDPEIKRSIAVITGVLFANTMREIISLIREKFPAIKIDLHVIRNDFFGEQITVAGLITGGDIIRQVPRSDTCEEILISPHMLRAGEETFLDDLTVSDVEAALGSRIYAAGPGGDIFVQAVIEGGAKITCGRRQNYEQTDSCDRGQA